MKKENKFNSILEIKNKYFPKDKSQITIDEENFGLDLADKSLEKLKVKISKL